MLKEEDQRKVRQELKATRKAAEEEAVQKEKEMEEIKKIEMREKDILGKGKAKVQEASSRCEEVGETDPKIPIMDAIPLKAIRPTSDPAHEKSTHLGQVTIKKTWDEILKQQGYKRKKQSASRGSVKLPRGYTKHMVHEFLERKAAKEKEKQKKVAQNPPPPGFHPD